MRFWGTMPASWPRWPPPAAASTGTSWRTMRLLGKAAAEDGFQLRALVVRHLAATRAAWPLTASADGTAADSVLAAVEQAVDAFAEGFERAQRMTVRREEAARREFIDDLLYGRSDLGRLRRAGHPVRAAALARARGRGGDGPGGVHGDRLRAAHGGGGAAGPVRRPEDPAHDEGRAAGLYRPRQPARRPAVLRQAVARGDGRRPRRGGPPAPRARRGGPLLRRGAGRAGSRGADGSGRPGAVRRRSAGLPGTDPRPAGDGGPGAQRAGPAPEGPRRCRAPPEDAHRLLRRGLRGRRDGPCGSR